MKKAIAVIAALVIMLVIMTGCANDQPIQSKSEKLQVVTTIFPIYDWVREILGGQAENVDLTLLLDNGVDLHSFQPSADDMIIISDCDLLIYTGGESDAWVEEALANANPNLAAMNLLDLMGEDVKEEEVVEGMQQDEHTHDEEEEHEHPDEHIWLSLVNAARLCNEIAETLGTIDPEHGQEYAENAARYIEELKGLDEEYQAVLGSAQRDTLLFADRFPFRYLMDDYNLKYYAAFSGCSAETEASFETVAFLAGKVDELGLPCVLTIDGSDGQVAKTVVSSTKTQDQNVLTLDSMQSVTTAQIEEGVSYLSIMKQNLEVLKTALN